MVAGSTHIGNVVVVLTGCCSVDSKERRAPKERSKVWCSSSTGFDGSRELGSFGRSTAFKRQILKSFLDITSLFHGKTVSSSEFS